MATVTSYLENQEQVLSDHYQPDVCYSKDQQAYEASHTCFDLKHFPQPTPFESAIPRTEAGPMPNHYTESAVSNHRTAPMPSYLPNPGLPKALFSLSLDPPRAVLPGDSQTWIYAPFIHSVDPDPLNSNVFNDNFNSCDDRGDFDPAYANFYNPQWPNHHSQQQREFRWSTSKQAEFQEQIFAKYPTPYDSFSSNNVPQLVGSSLVSTVPSSCSSASPKAKIEPDRIVDSVATNNNEANVEEKGGDIPYAKLIYSALMDAPGHKLVLRQIYSWIKENTDKGKDPAIRGWQNSVRHNLSMNGAFTKVPYTSSRERPKNGYIWVLEPSAIVNGIQSTTRYRRKDNSKRTSKHALGVTLQRQSGRRVIYASRKSARPKIITRSDRATKAQYPVQKVRDDSSNSAIESPSQSHQNLRVYGEANPSFSIPNGRHCHPTSPFRIQSSFADRTFNNDDNATRVRDTKLEEDVLANDYEIEKMPMSSCYGGQQSTELFSGMALDFYPPY